MLPMLTTSVTDRRLRKNHCMCSICLKPHGQDIDEQVQQFQHTYKTCLQIIRMIYSAGRMVDLTTGGNWERWVRIPDIDLIFKLSKGCLCRRYEDINWEVKSQYSAKFAKMQQLIFLIAILSIPAMVQGQPVSASSKIARMSGL